MQQDSAPRPPQIGLGFLIAATRRRLKQVVWARLLPYNLTPQQFWVLMVLSQKGPQSLHALAQEVWMDDPTASRVVKGLCERGILRTEADPAHGRRILIRPTQEGEGLIRNLEALTDEIRGHLLGGLDPDELVVVRRALTQMIGNLEALADRTPKARRPLPRGLKVSNL
jgi:DNA-binding MarR family transcriptional regulator